MADLFHIIRVILIFSLLSLISCAWHYGSYNEKSGVYHRVKKDETIGSIARIYKVNPERIAEANNIGSNDTIEYDSVLFIPDAKETVVNVIPSIGSKVKAGTSEKNTANKKNVFKEEKAAVVSKSSERLDKIPTGKDDNISENDTLKTIGNIDADFAPVGDKREIRSKIVPSKERAKPKTDTQLREERKKNHYYAKRFIFPVEGRVISRFGIQPNGLYHNGIEIAAKEGSVVIAAAEGMVIFSDQHPLKDYGETIIMKHDEDYITVYTNLGKRLVMRDEHLKKGDKIGVLPKPDLKGEAIIHFEVRHNNKAINPLLFFPDL